MPGGLTGGIASGKSTVSRRLSELGALVVDADAIARRLQEPGEAGYEAVVEHFGDTVVDAATGRLDLLGTALLSTGLLLVLGGLVVVRLHGEVGHGLAEVVAGELRVLPVRVLDEHPGEVHDDRGGVRRPPGGAPGEMAHDARVHGIAAAAHDERPRLRIARGGREAAGIQDRVERVVADLRGVEVELVCDLCGGHDQNCIASRCGYATPSRKSAIRGR